MKKTIVIACQGGGYLLKDIIMSYVRAGYSVTVILADDSWNLMVSELPKSVRHHSVITYNRSTYLKRLLTWTICTLQMFFLIGSHHREDEILYVSNPPFSSVLSLLFHNVFSLLIWDIYPDVLVNQRFLSSNSFIVRWWELINKKVFAKAKHIFTIGEKMKECLTKYTTEDKITVVPLWSNGKMIRVQSDDNLFIRKYNLDGKFIVLYSGNMGNTHRMEVLLDVAKNIEDNDILFLMVGEGGKKKMIEERVEQERLSNVMVLPRQPLEMLPHSLSSASLAVVTLDSTSAQVSVPSKTFNLMAVGAPLMCIASPDSELGNIVREYNVGKIFPPEDVLGMINFVRLLKKDKNLQSRYHTNALEAAGHFTSENAKMFIDNNRISNV